MRPQVCGIFLMFLSGVHVVLWWGLRCFPRIRLAYTVTYYSLAALTVVAAVRPLIEAFDDPSLPSRRPATLSSVLP